MKEKKIEYLQMMLDLFPDSGFENYASIEEIEQDENIDFDNHMFRVLYKLGDVEVVQNENTNIRTMCHGLIMGFYIRFHGDSVSINVIGGRYKISNLHVRAKYFHSHLTRYFTEKTCNFCISRSNLEGYLQARYQSEIGKFITGVPVDVNILNQSLKSYLLQISKIESSAGVPYMHIEKLTNDENASKSFSEFENNKIIEWLANEDCTLNWKFRSRVGFQLQNDTTLDGVLGTMANKLSQESPDHSYLRKADALGNPISVISEDRWLSTEEAVKEYAEVHSISMEYKFKGEFYPREIIMLPYEQQPIESYVFADSNVAENITIIINKKMNDEDETIKF